ncbi:MAG: low molecular weight protein arginine phosphatase [Caldicoprobacterales bacterium]
MKQAEKERIEVNVLFVCTGNTCRSPMAEALFKDLLKKKGIEGIQTGSAGLAALPGGKATQQAGRVMEELGISLTNHQTRQVDDELLKQADLILTMTEQHKSTIQASVPSVWDKIHTLKEYAGMEDKNISDPFGRSDEAYRRTAGEIRLALEKILDKLQK